MYNTLLLAQQTQQSQQTTGDNATLLIAIVLLVAALALFVVEVLVPSGGLLGLGSAGCLIGGVVMMCMVNLTWGLAVAIIALAALPFALGFAIKIWPDTSIGHWLSLQEPKPANESASISQQDQRIGAEGQAVTDLRPIGTCLIDGRREQCLASHGMIEAGQHVRVVSCAGMQLRVEAIEKVW